MTARHSALTNDKRPRLSLRIEFSRNARNSANDQRYLVRSLASSTFDRLRLQALTEIRYVRVQVIKQPAAPSKQPDGRALKKLDVLEHRSSRGCERRFDDFGSNAIRASAIRTLKWPTFYKRRHIAAYRCIVM